MTMHRNIMKDDYGPAMNWYKCAMQNLNLKDEQESNPNPKVEQPVLMVVAEEDPLSNAMAINAMRVDIANLKVVEIPAGHWVQIEEKEKVNSTLEEFFSSLGERI